MKPVVFVGSALSDLRRFPAGARREAGYQIDRVQRGEEPDNWKPLGIVGSGVREIRIRAGGAFRVVYVASLKHTIFVLHCFQKKTQKTGKADIDLAAKRHRDLMKDAAR